MFCTRVVTFTTADDVVVLYESGVAMDAFVDDIVVFSIPIVVMFDVLGIDEFWISNVDVSVVSLHEVPKNAYKIIGLIFLFFFFFV